MKTNNLMTTTKLSDLIQSDMADYVCMRVRYTSEDPERNSNNTMLKINSQLDFSDNSASVDWSLYDFHSKEELRSGFAALDMSASDLLSLPDVNIIKAAKIISDKLMESDNLKKISIKGQFFNKPSKSVDYTL